MKYIEINTIDLSDRTTTTDTDSDVDVGELLSAEDHQGLVDLGSESLRLDEVQRIAVDLDEALAFLAVGDGDSSFLKKCAHTHTQKEGEKKERKNNEYRTTQKKIKKAQKTERNERICS